MPGARPSFQVWQRFRRKRTALFGLAGAAVFVLVALLAPLLAPYGPLDMGPSFKAPGAPHLLGTDSLGSDVLSNVIYGARTSLLVGLCAVITSTLIGVTVGSISGYFGGRADNLLMRLTEMFQVLPQFFLAIIIVALFGSSIWNIIFVIGILTWPV